MMKVRIKKDISKSAPGWHYAIIPSNAGKFRAGQEVFIQIIHYPGQVRHYGICDDWDFWVNSDIDNSVIFVADEIDALILTTAEREKLKDAPLDNAPFTIIIS